MCFKAIEKNGLLLKEVRWDEINLTKEQINNLHFMAIRYNGLALKFAKEQTHDICLIAVEGDTSALRFVKRKVLSEDQFDKICRTTWNQILK